MSLSLDLQRKIVIYLTISSFSVLVWDILDNVKNDYRLLFRHRFGLPTLVYFISRIGVLCCIGSLVIFMTTPFLDCKLFTSVMIGFFIVGQTATVFLSYFRVCAVWQWNRYIVGFFGLTMLSVVGSCFTLIQCLKPIDLENTCIVLIEGPLILAPYITILFNHTAVVLAITYGVSCPNTMGDLTLRDGILRALGKSLPVFSRALLHDSQVSYLLIVGIALVSLAWLCGWKDIPSASPFRIAIIPVYIIVTNIIICRVYRNTKLGVHNQPVSLPTNESFRLPPSSIMLSQTSFSSP